jgi:ABC-type transport system involved in cytochrome c biogenesis permease subunit
MSGITTLCFASSYAVALGLEAARIAWRGRVRGLLAIGFAAAGLIAQMLYLGYWAANESVPLSSAYEWYLLAAAAVVATYLYLAIIYPSAASGLFVLPLALALVAAARYASKTPVAQSSAANVWVTIHMSFWLLGAIAVIVGFATGVMYLLQAYRLKHKLPPLTRFRLPNLEWLERANGRAIVISALMAGAGLASGIVLNLVNQRLPWGDPTISRSIVFFAWLLVAALFNAIYRPARKGRKVAYLTVASFLFLAIFLAAQLVGKSEHAGASLGARGQRPVAGRGIVVSWSPDHDTGPTEGLVVAWSADYDTGPTEGLPSAWRPTVASCGSVRRPATTRRADV